MPRRLKTSKPSVETGQLQRQVDLERRHAGINADEHQNGKPHAVPLNAAALGVLEQQKGLHPTNVFVYAGKPIANVSTKAWWAALERCDIENFRWYDLPHTWASWHRQEGTPTHELQRPGGWKTMAMVARYAHVAPEALAVCSKSAC